VDVRGLAVREGLPDVERLVREAERAAGDRLASR